MSPSWVIRLVARWVEWQFTTVCILLSFFPTQLPSSLSTYLPSISTPLLSLSPPLTLPTPLTPAVTRPGPDNDKLTAFPPNFRMLAGDPSKRSETDDFASRAISYKCVGVSGADIRHLPTDKCDQIRAQVTFPSCWDGKNTDSEDHKSHVVYPKDGNYDGGRCPESHPVHLVTLFSEVYYDTRGFKDQWYGEGQPFVLANGDATGYGYHGDFVNGWDVDALQKGLDSCPDGVENCAQKVFGEFWSQGETGACKLPSMIDEPVTGVLDKLPGCNEVSYGPEPAAKAENCDAPEMMTEISAKMAGYVDVSDQGFSYVGCGKDNALERTLNEELLTGDDMTVEKCVSFCKGKGKKYAGLEYSCEFPFAPSFSHIKLTNAPQPNATAAQPSPRTAPPPSPAAQGTAS